jgi:hypothetical protein
VGFAPEQINRMTFWEFASAMNGWARANGVKPKVQPPTDEEFEDAVARH